MCNTSLSGMAFWCFVGGSTYFWSRSCRCMIREFCTDASRVGSPRRFVRKDAYTSDTTSLTVTWRSLELFVVPNLFFCTYVVNDDTIIVLYHCGIPSRDLSLMPVCERNLHHLSQLPDCLVVVTLGIPLVVSRMSLVTISRRWYFRAEVWYGMMRLYVVEEWIFKYLLGNDMRCGNALRVILIWCSWFPWYLGSIGMPCYWRYSISSIEQLCHGLPRLLVRMMLFASTIGRLRYPQRLVCGILVPVDVWSCRLIFLRQVTPVGSVLVSHSIQGGCSIKIPWLWRCILLSHISRHRTILWMLDSWRLCYLLVLLYLWTIRGSLSRGEGLACARYGGVVVPTYFPFSEVSLVDSGST